MTPRPATEIVQELTDVASDVQRLIDELRAAVEASKPMKGRQGDGSA